MSRLTNVRVRQTFSTDSRFYSITDWLLTIDWRGPLCDRWRYSPFQIWLGLDGKGRVLQVWCRPWQPTENCRVLINDVTGYLDNGRDVVVTT